MIEEEIDSLLSQLENNKKVAFKLQDIKEKVHKCLDFSKTLLIPSLDLKEQALTLHSVYHGEKSLFEDRIFVKQDYEKFLQIALE